MSSVADSSAVNFTANKIIPLKIIIQRTRPADIFFVRVPTVII